jgi:glycine/D-amino acid oxidase-like deaminating enzyme
MKIAESILIITGASSGIGAATARELARRGATVVLAARRAEELNRIANDITQSGQNALAVPTDVRSRESIDHLDPHILDFLKALEAQGGPPLYTLSAASARNALLSVQRSVNVPKLPATSSDRTIRGGPTGEISLRIVRPQGASGALPGVMYFHGGGWILGDKETHDRLVREIATGAQATVVFVEYARSPEAKYPVAIEQAYRR